MDFWTRAAQLVLSLSILVILHELGHYIPAKLFKTRVEKFYLFFNPWFSLFKKKIGDTEWGIGWLPLGGYVKIAGMVDESMDKEQLAQPAQPWEFRSKKAWQRLIIMVGGVTVNLILGIFIYILIVYSYGEKKLSPSQLQHGLEVHPYLSKYGLHSGDKIIALNGEKVENALDPNVEIMLRGKRKLTVEHDNGKISTVNLPEAIEYQLFKEGAFPAFSYREKSSMVQGISAVKEVDLGKQKIIYGDEILEINKKPLDEIALAVDELSAEKKNVSIKWVSGADTVVTKLSKKQIKPVLAAFPALKAGIRKGDRILQINEQKITYFDDIHSALYFSKGKTVSIKIQRGGLELSLKSKISKEGMLGFKRNGGKLIDEKSVKTVYYSFGESIGHGVKKGLNTLSDYAGQLKFLFTEKGASSVGGFGSIGKMFPPQWDWQIFWLNTAFISIVLAFMNILPIPALDGGHIMFLLYEIITGKEAPQKVLEYAQIVGFVLLLSLLVYANGNDIYQSFFK